MSIQNQRLAQQLLASIRTLSQKVDNLQSSEEDDGEDTSPDSGSTSGIVDQKLQEKIGPKLAAVLKTHPFLRKEGASQFMVAVADAIIDDHHTGEEYRANKGAYDTPEYLQTKPNPTGAALLEGEEREKMDMAMGIRRPGEGFQRLPGGVFRMPTYTPSEYRAILARRKAG